MDKEDFMDYLRGFLLIVIVGVVLVLVIFGLVRLGIAIFDGGKNINMESIRLCELKGGTPVLEDHGKSYKSCAINGRSETRNLVR